MENKKNKPNIESILKNAYQEEVFPGAQAGWIELTHEKDSTISLISVGKESTPDSSSVTDQTIYDTASLTKSICTGLLAHWMVEQGRWSWDDLLVTWLPEFQSPDKNKITLRHLISFGAPFGLTLSRLKNLSADEMWDRILNASLIGELGAEPVYVNTSSILLGRAIELTTGETLPNLAERLLWQPLGMHKTDFLPDVSQAIAPSEIDLWRANIFPDGEIRGQVHDESAWVLREKFVAGSAGLFSTASDILVLLESILKAGKGEPSQLPLSQATVQSFAQNVFPPDSNAGSLGWELNADWMGNVPPGTFGKTGFTGCCVVVNLELGCAGVLLSNATYPTRPTDRTALTKLRQEFCETVLKQG